MKNKSVNPLRMEGVEIVGHTPDGRIVYSITVDAAIFLQDAVNLKNEDLAKCAWHKRFSNMLVGMEVGVRAYTLLMRESYRNSDRYIKTTPEEALVIILHPSKTLIKGMGKKTLGAIKAAMNSAGMSQEETVL